MRCDEYRDLIAADVDGQLGADEQHAADSHRATCAQCAELHREQHHLVALLRARAPKFRVPTTLREQVQQRYEPLDRRSLRWRRVVLVGVAVAAVVLVVVSTLRSRPEATLAKLAEDVHEVEAGKAALAIRTDSIEELRRYYRSTGKIDFERSADDLRSAGLRLIGGAVHTLDHVTTTFTLYDGPRGVVVCRRFRVGSIRLPGGGERIGHDQVFTVDGVTIAVMHLGDIVCTLATNIPRAEFVRYLRTAKGM
ncbi:MAG TPA: hypothetical protein VMW17_08920 [Candidatus Binatia bacterium]|nr:hypothetical protein [Candidatus Binatia bacterium]